MFAIKVKGTGRIVDTLNRIRTNIPITSKEDALESVKIMQEEIRHGVLNAGIKDFDKKLLPTLYFPGGIRQTPEGYGLTTPLGSTGKPYIWSLSEAPAHPVAVHKRPRLRRWAKQKMGYIPKIITVKPKHFMIPALKRGGERSREYLKRGRTVKMLKNRGRV